MNKFDQTDLSSKHRLSISGAVGIHRDYIAHCFRWSFATRRIGNIKLNGQYRNILDFGCGKEVPFADTLCSSRSLNSVGSYIGVDLNPIILPAHRKILDAKDNWTFLGETNILDITPKTTQYVNTIVSFEVFEHCPKDITPTILKHLHSLMTYEDGEFIYSTPSYCHKTGAAKNHMNEMTRDYFGWLLEETGHTIIENYGTFASQYDYKKHLSPAQLEVFYELSAYHHPSVLSNFFAPALPQYSRNNIWVCKKRKDGDSRLFPTPGEKPYAQWDT